MGWRLDLCAKVIGTAQIGSGAPQTRRRCISVGEIGQRGICPAKSKRELDPLPKKARTTGQDGQGSIRPRPVSGRGVSFGKRIVYPTIRRVCTGPAAFLFDVAEPPRRCHLRAKAVAGFMARAGLVCRDPGGARKSCIFVAASDLSAIPQARPVRTGRVRISYEFRADLRMRELKTCRPELPVIMTADNRVRVIAEKIP